MAAEDEQFDYKPGRGASEEPKNHHSVSWTASEYIDHTRGTGWYFMLLVGSAVLATLIYFFTKDILGAAIVIALAVIVAVMANRKPSQLTYTLSNAELQAGTKTYKYSQFRSFAIIREGDLNSLLLTPLKRFVPPVSIYFDEDDEDKIVRIISEHLPLEKKSPDRIDMLTRRLRF